MNELYSLFLKSLGFSCTTTWKTNAWRLACNRFNDNIEQVTDLGFNSIFIRYVRFSLRSQYTQHVVLQSPMLPSFPDFSSFIHPRLGAGITILPTVRQGSRINRSVASS